MKQRNLWAMLPLMVVTFGIYWIVWFVKTRGEMGRLGGKIPTAWLLLVPFVNYYLLYKYYRAAEFVTGRVKAKTCFAWHLFAGAIGLVVSFDAIGRLIFNLVDKQPLPDQSALISLLDLAGGMIVIGLSIYLQSAYNQTPTPRPPLESKQ